MATLRRLDDGTRYYFLTWRQWAAALTGGGVLYVAVRFSPLSQKWTFTAVLLVLASVAVAIMPLTGNALGLDRYLAAIVRWTLGPKQYTLAGRAATTQRGGVLLSTIPASVVDEDDDRVDWPVLDDDARAQPV
jgi:PrgI family protein